LTLPVLDDIAGMFLQIFGHPAIITLVIIAFFLISLVILRSHVWVMLAIMLPLLISFAFSGTTLIYVSKSTIILLIFILGFAFSMAFVAFQR